MSCFHKYSNGAKKVSLVAVVMCVVMCVSQVGRPIDRASQ